MASPEEIESLADARHFGSQLRRLLPSAPTPPARRRAYGLAAPELS